MSAPRRRDPVTELTPRQDEILALVSEGLASKEVARRLNISPQTVKNQLAAIRETMGARTTAHAIAVWVMAKVGHHE